jgi:hypothetical protein
MFPLVERRQVIAMIFTASGVAAGELEVPGSTSMSPTRTAPEEWVFGVLPDFERDLSSSHVDPTRL